MKVKIILFASLSLLFSRASLYSQQTETVKDFVFTERVQTAPESVFNKFKEAGMEPTEHILTVSEAQIVNHAFFLLPPLHQKILKEHLYSISFMDNMPNTALTSPVEFSDSGKMFNITCRAEVINETISQWATWKENTYYSSTGNDEYQLKIEAGTMDAFTYILLHEATHIVDGILHISANQQKKPKSFTANIWVKMNEPNQKATNGILETSRFRNGKPLPLSASPAIYKALSKSPFVSLYSMASWHEDLAELVTIYHLTQKLNQRYRLVIEKNGANVMAYEPYSNRRVLKRQGVMKMFYKQ